MEKKPAKNIYALRYKNYIANRQKLKEKEETTKKPLSYPDNWVDLIAMAKQAKSPDFSQNTLGDDLLNFGLEKCARSLSKIINELSFKEAKQRIIKELKSDRVASNNAESTLRFLRNVNVDIFLVCPECGYENAFDWEFCEQCKSENTNQ